VWADMEDTVVEASLDRSTRCCRHAHVNGRARSCFHVLASGGRHLERLRRLCRGGNVRERESSRSAGLRRLCSATATCERKLDRHLYDRPHHPSEKRPLQRALDDRLVETTPHAAADDFSRTLFGRRRRASEWEREDPRSHSQEMTVSRTRPTAEGNDPLPVPAALMARRGSTVRVRQRALQERRT
jgi:hypothetical protein